jgi:hypothetical protein
MGEWECSLVAKASLDHEKTRVLVGIQWTMGDLTLKLHAQPPSINHNDDEQQQTNNARLSLSKPATLAVCKHYLSALQTNYKPSKSAGTRLENIPHVVDLAAFPAPHLYPLNADLTNDQCQTDHIDAKTVPAKNNGLFDSKVFSQQRAEGWEENTKVCCYATTPFFHGIIHVLV